MKANVFIVGNYKDAENRARENHHGEAFGSLVGNDWCYIENDQQMLGKHHQDHIFYYIHIAVSRHLLVKYGYIVN